MFRAVVLAEGDSVGLAEFPQIAAQVSTQAAAQLPSPAAGHDPTKMRSWNQSGRSRSRPLEPDVWPQPLADRAARLAAQSSALLDALPLLDAAGEVRPLEEIEAELIRYAITHYRGQMSEVARRLRIGRSTLYRKLEALGLTPQRLRARGSRVGRNR